MKLEMTSDEAKAICQAIKVFARDVESWQDSLDVISRDADLTELVFGLAKLADLADIDAPLTLDDIE
jgi:hypothetical protein